jgi:nucleoside-diphosphate-sugar epimerase
LRVLVTGGGGFIGSHLVRALLERGDSVRVLDDWSTGLRSRLQGLRGDLAVLDGDIRDEAAARAAVEGCDAVLHEAAQVSVAASVEAPRHAADVNVTGLATMLQAALGAGATRFVLASSCAVYGEPRSEEQSEDDETAPASPYAASKLAGEAFVRAACREGLRGVSLRYFNVFGAGQRPDSAYAAVVPAFAQALREGRTLEIHGDGEQSRDLVHVGDVVRANLAALQAPDAALGRAFNVGTGRATSVNELARLMAGELAVPLKATHGAARAGDVRRSRASVRRAESELGFRASVGLAEGLRLTLREG